VTAAGIASWGRVVIGLVVIGAGVLMVVNGLPPLLIVVAGVGDELRWDVSGVGDNSPVGGEGGRGADAGFPVGAPVMRPVTVRGLLALSC
jgi:hypothetical protein